MWKVLVGSPEMPRSSRTYQESVLDGEPTTGLARASTSKSIRASCSEWNPAQAGVGHAVGGVLKGQPLTGKRWAWQHGPRGLGPGAGGVHAMYAGFRPARGLSLLRPERAVKDACAAFGSRADRHRDAAINSRTLAAGKQHSGGPTLELHRAQISLLECDPAAYPSFYELLLQRLDSCRAQAPRPTACAPHLVACDCQLRLAGASCCLHLNDIHPSSRSATRLENHITHLLCPSKRRCQRQRREWSCCYSQPSA
jgi:hypothetical protein